MARVDVGFAFTNPALCGESFFFSWRVRMDCESVVFSVYVLLRLPFEFVEVTVMGRSNCFFFPFFL